MPAGTDWAGSAPRTGLHRAWMEFRAWAGAGFRHVPGSVEARQAGVCAWPAVTRYGVEKGIYFSYPCISRFGTLAPVLNLPVDPYSAEMMEKCPSSPHPPPCRWPLPNSSNGSPCTTGAEKSCSRSGMPSQPSSSKLPRPPTDFHRTSFCPITPISFPIRSSPLWSATQMLRQLTTIKSAPALVSSAR